MQDSTPDQTLRCPRRLKIIKVLLCSIQDGVAALAQVLDTRVLRFRGIGLLVGRRGMESP
jgi:hypothetical protein